MLTPVEIGGRVGPPKSQSDSRRGELLRVPKASRLKLSSFISSHRLPNQSRRDVNDVIQPVQQKHHWDFRRLFIHPEEQSPWCSGPVRPPLCACHRARCRSHPAAFQAAGWGDCGKGPEPCGGEGSERGRGTWAPDETVPGAAPGAGGAGAWVDRAGTVWQRMEAAPALGWAAGGLWGSRAAALSRAPKPCVCSSPGGLWSACPAHL